MPNTDEVTNNQILGYDDLYPILKNYRENSESLTPDECLIGEHIEEAIKSPFEQDGLFCSLMFQPMLTSTRTVLNKKDSLRSENLYKYSKNLYEYNAIFKWCHKDEKMEDPYTRETVKELYIDLGNTKFH